MDCDEKWSQVRKRDTTQEDDQLLLWKLRYAILRNNCESGFLMINKKADMPGGATRTPRLGT